MTKLEKAIEYVDKLWKQQPNEFGIMPDLGNEFMWVVDFMQEQEAENKHNYKAREEMHNNSVSYATKIQNELNELKRRLPNLLQTAIQCGYGVEHTGDIDLQEKHIVKELLSKVGSA